MTTALVVLLWLGWCVSFELHDRRVAKRREAAIFKHGSDSIS
jgi:hypothetical protein